jgi:hypothetical protein
MAGMDLDACSEAEALDVDAGTPIPPSSRRCKNRAVRAIMSRGFTPPLPAPDAAAAAAAAAAEWDAIPGDTMGGKPMLGPGPTLGVEAADASSLVGDDPFGTPYPPEVRGGRLPEP